jgi:polar amino acid transport system ATP-binding protein
MQPIVALRDVSVGWGARVVLTQLDLEVHEGEVLCLLGPGGSGKSTILRLLEDLVGRPDGDPTNQLWWRGSGHASCDACARLRQHGDFSRERVGELLIGSGSTLVDEWMPPGPDERAALMAMLDWPLRDTPDPLRRFFSFMMVASSSAPLLLFDEPLFALEGNWRQAVRGHLRRLADAGRTMVLVTHYLPLARELADRVMLVVDGRVIESGPTEDFFARARHPRTRQFIEWGA